MVRSDREIIIPGQSCYLDMQVYTYGTRYIRARPVQSAAKKRAGESETRLIL